jgi:hypothetical protein
MHLHASLFAAVLPVSHIHFPRPYEGLFMYNRVFLKAALPGG